MSDMTDPSARVFCTPMEDVLDEMNLERLVRFAHSGWSRAPAHVG